MNRLNINTINQNNFKLLFEDMHPEGFFTRSDIVSLPSEESFYEMIMDLQCFDYDRYNPSLSDDISFGYYNGNYTELIEAVGKVDKGWCSIIKPDDRMYCGFCKEKLATFCIVEDMGTHMLDGISYRIGGPGCVGSLPQYRNKGIALTMVNQVTKILAGEGYDFSYIHYTGVPQWYSKLGYETILVWGNDGYRA